MNSEEDKTRFSFRGWEFVGENKPILSTHDTDACDSRPPPLRSLSSRPMHANFSSSCDIFPPPPHCITVASNLSATTRPVVVLGRWGIASDSLSIPLYLGRWSKELEMTLPEMVFGGSHLTVSSQSLGSKFTFNARDSLKACGKDAGIQVRR